MTEVNQPRTGAFQAVVRAGADETPYQRAGAGQPIVVVSIAAIDDPECQALVFALAASHRVYVPGIRGSPKDFSGWFRLFLDGIGLEAVALVAEEALAVPLARRLPRRSAGPAPRSEQGTCRSRSESPTPREEASQYKEGIG